jgi:LysR family glycine cleavage system transcriptional activator
MSVLHKSPPIQYLPAFVAAARFNSFKLAASELNVTPSAISQQIKTLENHMGIKLFSRKKRNLKLTFAGTSFYKMAQNTLNQYEYGCKEFNETHLSSTLKVSMIPYIANEVLIPKLAEFHTLHPDINLIIHTSVALENLHVQELDAAIRFGTPPWPEQDVADVVLISHAQSALVASKKYLSKCPINGIDDWQKQTLIHSRNHINDWQVLITKLNFKPQQQLVFDSYDASIRAAEEGLGIAIAVLPISHEKIRTGKLVPLSSNYKNIDENFYLVSKPNDHKQANIVALHLWLKSIFEAAK